MKKDKNEADKNGARPHFQTERWTRQLQNGAWPHFHGTVMNRFCCHCEERSDVAISKKEKKG